MGYAIFPNRNDQYTARPGLEGPFEYPNGQVLYYDPKEGMYWDPRTDFYVPLEEVKGLQQSVFDLINRA